MFRLIIIATRILVKAPLDWWPPHKISGGRIVLEPRLRKSSRIWLKRRRSQVGDQHLIGLVCFVRTPAFRRTVTSYMFHLLIDFDLWRWGGLASIARQLHT